MKKLIEIDLEKLTEHGIDAHMFCILYSVYYKNSRILLSYLNSVGKPNLSIFQKLSDLGYIEPLKEGQNPTIENLNLTEKFTSLFISKEAQIEFNKLFDELLNEYPKVVAGRRLHTEKDNCKTLYKKTLIQNNEIDYTLHDNIIRALKKEKQERLLSNNLTYMTQLIRYIRNKGWEPYMEELETERKSFKKII
jgi:hypothetical protein